MNAPIAASRIAPIAGTDIDAEERALRVQLAAAYRIADHRGWSEPIYTHDFLTDRGAQPLGQFEFDALARVIDRKDPSYRN